MLTTRPTRRAARCVLAALAVLMVGLLVVPTTAAQAPVEVYDFLNTRADAHGVTVDLAVEDLLPVEDLVGLSSVTAEARLSSGQATALAVLPDPGELIRSLPGTLGGLTGIGGLPDYPAAARADDPVKPEDEVQLAPDGGLGGGRLRAEASREHVEGEAFVAGMAAPVGLAPFTFGSVRSSAVSRMVAPLAYEVTATSEVSDLRVLDGLVRIAGVTSTATIRVDRGVASVEESEVIVSGARLLGYPIGITEDGIAVVDESQPLGPIVSTLVAPLEQSGITIELSPSLQQAEGGSASAAGGSLVISLSTTVDSYPTTIRWTFGSTDVSVEASSSDEPQVDAGSVTPIVPDPSETASAEPALRAPGAPQLEARPSAPSVPPSNPVVSPPGRETGTDDLAVAASSHVPIALDFRPLYPWLVVGAAALMGGRYAIRSLAEQSAAHQRAVKTLWRW